jgi:hypothetical protein
MSFGLLAEDKTRDQRNVAPIASCVNPCSRDKRILDLYLAYRTIDEIADAVGVHVNTIDSRYINTNTG